MFRRLPRMRVHMVVAIINNAEEAGIGNVPFCLNRCVWRPLAGQAGWTVRFGGVAGDGGWRRHICGSAD